MVALALRLLLQWTRSHLGTCHTGGTTWATQTWQTRVTPATNNALRTWFTWCALFKRRSDQSIWNIFNIQFMASYSWQIQSLSTWLNEYLPFLLVHLVALFHLLRQAHLLLQQVLDHRENRRYQGVQEAHPCLQARHYQGDLGYPRKNFRKKSELCFLKQQHTLHWHWPLLMKANQGWVIAWGWIGASNLYAPKSDLILQRESSHIPLSKFFSPYYLNKGLHNGTPTYFGSPVVVAHPTWETCSLLRAVP